MNRYPKWKYILVAAVILIGLLYTIPNFYGESPAVQVSPTKSTLKADQALLSKVEATLKLADIKFNGIFLDASGVKVRFANPEDQLKAKDKLITGLGKGYTVALNLLSQTPNWLLGIGAKPMYLGLDLRGGVHFLLQVDMKAALDKAAESSVGDFRTSLRRDKINYFGISRDGQKVEVKFESEAELSKAEKLLNKDYPDLTYSSSGSGKEFTLTAVSGLAAQKRIQEFALKQNLQTLHNRINELGVAEPIVQQQGLDRIVVQLPGVQDTAKAKEILGRTATLEIRMVDEEKTDIATLEKAAAGQVPFGDEMYKDREGRPILVKKSVVLTGDRITDAGPGVNQQTGGSIVNVTLDGRGAGIFKNVTRDNVGKRMAILLIEKGSTEVITAPVINEEIGGGRVQISGMDSPQEATDISLLLRAGALAAPRAFPLVQAGQEIRRVDGAQVRKLPGCNHGLAAAAAAVADEAYLPLHVFAELDEVVLVGPLQKAHALGDRHGAHDPVADERVRSPVEGHADIHGGLAGAPHMTHLVAAVAHGDPDVRGRLDDAACPLVIQDVDSAVRRKGRLLDEGAAQLCLACHEEGLDEILLLVDVLIVQLAQGLLVDVGAQAHEREFEEARHRRRHDIDAVAVLFDVEKDPAVGQSIQDFPGLPLPHLPDRGGLARIERPDGQHRYEFRLLLREEHLEDPVEELRRRSTLGKLIDALHETLVCGLELLMGHGEGSCMTGFRILPAAGFTSKSVPEAHARWQPGSFLDRMRSFPYSSGPLVKKHGSARVPY